MMKLNVTRVEINKCRVEYNLVFGDEELAEMNNRIEKAAGRRMEVSFVDVTNVMDGIFTPKLQVYACGTLSLYDLVKSCFTDMVRATNGKTVTGGVENYWNSWDLVEEE